MNIETEDRLIALEIASAEQERTITELSDEIARQWQMIDRLQKTLNALTQRFLALEEQATPGGSGDEAAALVIRYQAEGIAQAMPVPFSPQ